jgi:hypothetical protein
MLLKKNADKLVSMDSLLIEGSKRVWGLFFSSARKMKNERSANVMKTLPTTSAADSVSIFQSFFFSKPQILRHTRVSV